MYLPTHPLAAFLNSNTVHTASSSPPRSQSKAFLGSQKTRGVIPFQSRVARFYVFFGGGSVLGCLSHVFSGVFWPNCNLAIGHVCDGSLLASMLRVGRILV